MKIDWTWVKSAGIRALKTVAQTAVALISVGKFMSDIDWMQVLSASLLAGILSILTSIAGLPEVKQANAIKDAEESYRIMLHEANDLREQLYGEAEDADAILTDSAE